MTPNSCQPAVPRDHRQELDVHARYYVPTTFNPLAPMQPQVAQGGSAALRYILSCAPPAERRSALHLPGRRLGTCALGRMSRDFVQANCRDAGLWRFVLSVAY